ncbi:MAG: transcription antitermination factor NusB, partial [Chitinophagaceae bacterium]
ESKLPPIHAIKILEQHLDQSRRLFTYLVHFLIEICRYSETYSRQRASKHLVTAEDLNVNIKLAGNALVWQILENKQFEQSKERFHIENSLDADLLKKMFLKLLESPEYKLYIEIPSREKKDEKKILEFIFNELLLIDDHFISHIEEEFLNWDDDAEMMQLMMLNFLSKPNTYQFQDLISQEKLDFGKNLVLTAIDKKDYCMELIKPKLKNWDAERIALLDMIIMRMGTCEFLYFETIPAKVTINEYIDLAKDYSTPQSGQFVNGILDNIHKELSLTDKLRKVDYKKH